MYISEIRRCNGTCRVGLYGSKLGLSIHFFPLDSLLESALPIPIGEESTYTYIFNPYVLFNARSNISKK
jgi:hypothetical protein